MKNSDHDSLNAAQIKGLLHTPGILLRTFNVIESTHELMKSYLKNNTTIQAAIADTQTKGHGRLDRPWHSPAGKNIYLSVLYPFDKKLHELSGLSIIIGLAVCNMLEAFTGLKNTFLLKWPNDILASTQKMGGVLIDLFPEKTSMCQAIISLGLNINMQNASSTEINQPWTSLSFVTHQFYDRNNLCAELINYVLNYIERFLKNGFEDFLSDWQKKDYLLGKPVQLHSGNILYEGISAGVNADGQLLVELKDKNTKAFSSGDTTIFKE